jgi:putative two-component system hydrogenase maturation factor HypX/HoxX
MGLLDDHFGAMPAAFREEVERRARELAQDAGFAQRVTDRNQRRQADEVQQPLESYRAAELGRMKLNFFGFDSSYHVARFNFVHKVPRSRTPLYLARHRAIPRTSTANESHAMSPVAKLSGP